MRKQNPHTRASILAKARTFEKAARKLLADSSLDQDKTVWTAKLDAARALRELANAVRLTAPSRIPAKRIKSIIPTYEVERGENPNTCTFRCPGCGALHTHSMPAEKDVPEHRPAHCYDNVRERRHPSGYHIVWRGK